MQNDSMSGPCAVLTGVQKTCSDDGCTVLTGGMLSRSDKGWGDQPNKIKIFTSKRNIKSFSHLIFL